MRFCIHFINSKKCGNQQFQPLTFSISSHKKFIHYMCCKIDENAVSFYRDLRDFMVVVTFQIIFNSCPFCKCSGITPYLTCINSIIKWIREIRCDNCISSIYWLNYGTFQMRLISGHVRWFTFWCHSHMAGLPTPR